MEEFKMDKTFEVNLSKEEQEKIAKLNSINIEDIDNLDVEWTVKLLIQRIQNN